MLFHAVCLYSPDDATQYDLFTLCFAGMNPYQSWELLQVYGTHESALLDYDLVEIMTKRKEKSIPDSIMMLFLKLADVSLCASVFIQVYLLGREQIRAVSVLVHTDQTWNHEASDMQRLSSEDVLQLAHHTFDSASLRMVLNDSEVLRHVRNSPKQVVRVWGKVSGSDSERHKFHVGFEASRVYHGIGVFFAHET